MSKNIEHQQLKLEARKKIRNIENDIKSEKMEMQSLIDQGRLITVPSPPANEQAPSQAAGKQEQKTQIPSKPEKLYVIKVEPQRPAPRTIAIEEKPPAKRVKLEAKTEKKIKIENGEGFDPTGSVPPPSTPTLGRPPKTKKAKELKAAQVSKVQNRKLPKCLEPKRRKTHWDYLLDEVKWMATDFYQERRWKKEAAKFFAEACCEELKRRKNLKIEEINWRKRNAAAVSEIVRQWWNSLGALSEYRNILMSKKNEEKKLNLRPLTPDTADDSCFEQTNHKSEIELLEEDAKTPLHMICDLDKLYPDVKVKRSDLPKIAEKDLREADQLKQRIQELQTIKNIEHNFRFDIELAHYQLQGIKWMINSRTLGLPCHLADEKGLAKRTQIIVYLQNSVGTSLLVVQNQDLFYWLAQLSHKCPDFKYCMHDGNVANVLSDVDLVITTYEIASKSEFLLSTRWNSLVFDNVPSSKDIDSRALATLKLISANHKVAVTHTKPTSNEANSNSNSLKNESIVSILLFPDCLVSSRQLGNFTFARSQANVPDKDRPRNTIYKTVKCAMKKRQKILYEDMLIQSKEDLDSQDLDRVMSAVKRLLRVCNHADFRKLPKTKQVQINRETSCKPVHSLLSQLCFVKSSRGIFESEPANLLNRNSRVEKSRLKELKSEIMKEPMEKADDKNQQQKTEIKEEKTIKSEPEDEFQIESDKPEPKIFFPNNDFSGQNSIYEDTISSCRIKFNEHSSSRRGALEFSNRLKNRKRSPWALSSTLKGISSVVSNVPVKYRRVELYPRIFVNNETPNKLLAYENAKMQFFCSTKLENLAIMMERHQKLIKKADNAEKKRPMKTMICVRSEESADLVRSFFLLKLKVESVYISPHATKEEKNRLIHQFNFSKTMKLLLFNTRAGHLPLPPIGIENIYFYEDEILPAARQIFDEDTVWRINPKMVIRMVAKDTVEERICTFSPKIYGQTIQGVHALLTSVVPIDMNPLKDRRRASALPWQLKLCNKEELSIAEKLMNLPPTEEEDDEENMETDADCLSLSETIFSDDEDQILSELTSIEKFALRQIDYDNNLSSRKTESVVSPAPNLNSFFDPLESVNFKEDDLFISSEFLEATLVDRKQELIPVWAPPTPPRESTMDSSYGNVNNINAVHYRTELWESAYESKPMALSVSKTRPILSPLPKAEHELPLSFFHRNTKAIMNHRKQLKNEPKTQHVQTQFSNHPWLIDHELTLAMAVEDFCRNSNVPVNWEEVASIINTYSSSYHSPSSAKQHYENEIIPREEGKPAIVPGQKVPKVSKKAQLLGSDRKAGQKMRSKTAQMYLQDNNSSMSKHFKTIFNDLLDVTIKKDERHRDINQVILKPIPKLERTREDKDGNYPDKEGHRSIIKGYGINPDACLTPLEIIKKYKHRGLPQELNNARAGVHPLATPMGTPRTPSSPSSNRPIKNQWHPPGTQPQQMPSHVQVRQKQPNARKRPGSESMGGPGQKIFYQGGMQQVQRYTSPQEVHPRKVNSPRPGHHVQHRAQVPPNQQFVIQNGKPIQINTGSSGIQIQSPVNQHPIKTEYVPQVAISGANQGIQLVKTVVNPKQEPPDSHEQGQNQSVVISTVEQQVNDQPQMIYVQSNEGNKITLKPLASHQGRQIIQIPQPNAQYISINQHGKVIGSQGGPPKLYIKNSGASGTPHQVVLQPDGSQQLVIPSNMIPQQRLLVQTSTGNIIPQGNKIFIQQTGNINQPIILNQGQQIITNNGQILTLQPQQGKGGRMFVTQQPQQRVMVQQAPRGGNARANQPQQVMMANSSKNIVQVQQQPIQQSIINPIGGQTIQTTIQPNQPALPASAETNVRPINQRN
ncbi:Oidioi.mRNA.OKI2018_I69.PAR.g12588.t1.cds [Oikopleura dioica]|uniref:Oidioi.mRNA.OKI2018_I69.PAR.g12588.t1.cds n=1 Tax=Oikopleura dioica TaxID=34765 RepID=A0ABN7S0L1_OIKDI|nr:Oidioi.mRNA.OKI2018_I69.PAR.g12588.t1.cds [Oikopleura dioica]